MEDVVVALAAEAVAAAEAVVVAAVAEAVAAAEVVVVAAVAEAVAAAVAVAVALIAAFVGWFWSVKTRFVVVRSVTLVVAPNEASMVTLPVVGLTVMD